MIIYLLLAIRRFHVTLSVRAERFSHGVYRAGEEGRGDKEGEKATNSKRKPSCALPNGSRLQS